MRHNSRKPHPQAIGAGNQELPIESADPASEQKRRRDTDVVQLVEYGCWFVLGLAPVLYWVNGPAVSTDQLVVRSVLVAMALGAAAALRLVKLGGVGGARRNAVETRENG